MARPRTPHHRSPNQANSQSELGQKTGLPRQRIKRLVRDGLRRRADGTFHVADALRLAERRSLRDPGFFGNSEAAHLWLERRNRAIALRLEHELSARTRELVSIVDVRRCWSLQADKVKKAFSGLGADLAPQMAGRGPQEIEAVRTQRVLFVLRAVRGGDVFHSPPSKQTDA